MLAAKVAVKEELGFRRAFSFLHRVQVNRADGREFLHLAAEILLRPEGEESALQDANRTLRELKSRRVRRAKVLRSVGWVSHSP